MQDEQRRRLEMAPSLDAHSPASGGFPSSRKVEQGELRVPARVIEQSGGNAPLTVYDTSGPNVDPHQGLPLRRQAWIEARRRAPDFDGNFSQMHYARRG